MVYTLETDDIKKVDFISCNTNATRPLLFVVHNLGRKHHSNRCHYSSCVLIKPDQSTYGQQRRHHPTAICITAWVCLCHWSKQQSCAQWFTATIRHRLDSTFRKWPIQHTHFMNTMHTRYTHTFIVPGILDKVLFEDAHEDGGQEASQQQHRHTRVYDAEPVDLQSHRQHEGPSWHCC